MKNKIIKLSFIIRLFLVRLFLNLNKKLGHVLFPKQHLYYRSKNIKIKTLSYSYKDEKINTDVKAKMFNNRPCGYYDWNALVEDIKLNGIKNNIMVMVGISEIDPDYLVLEGHHRLKALEMIHGKGSDVEIKADIYVPFNYVPYLKLLKKNKIDLAKKRLVELKKKIVKSNNK